MRSVFVLATLVAAAVCVAATTRPSTMPATRPAVATTKPVDEVAAVRSRLLQWTWDVHQESLEEFRKSFFTRNEREARYADWLAHEILEECKTQKAVHDKWGTAVEARFAHLFGTDTEEDDRTATIVVHGDSAVVTYKSKAISPDPMIKVDGKWLLDVSSSLAAELKTDPEADKHLRPTNKLMATLRDEIAANSFPDAGEFILSFQGRLNAR